MNPNTFNAASLPTPLVLPEKPTPPPLSNESPTVPVLQDKFSQIRNKPSKQSIYQKYFNRSFGTGKSTVLKNFGGGLLGGKLYKGLKTTLKAFRRNPSGSGRNLSYKDIEHISNKIGDTLKSIPINKTYDVKKESIPLKKERKLIRSFKEDVKAGKISKADLDDARRIIENIQI